MKSLRSLGPFPDEASRRVARHESASSSAGMCPQPTTSLSSTNAGTTSSTSASSARRSFSGGRSFVPWPTGARYPGWFMLPYLVGADIVNTALSAFLAFCDRPVYSYYLRQPNPFHVSPLADQVVGAVIMWVVGSLVFLVPAIFITVRLLQQDSKLRV